MLKNSEKRCGSNETQSGNPFRYTKPCPYHTAGGAKKAPKKKSVTILRLDKLIEERAQGKTLKEAALAAGYSNATASSGKVSQIWNSPHVQARIERLRLSSHIQNDEIVGTLVEQMRCDIAEFFPDDPFLQRAKELGISHLIKKIKRRPVIAGFDKDGAPIRDYVTEIEVHSSFDAAKHLGEFFGLKKLSDLNKKTITDFNAAVERVMQQAIDCGVDLKEDDLRREVEKRLKPLHRVWGQA